jgi:hypothetical protein
MTVILTSASFEEMGPGPAEDGPRCKVEGCGRPAVARMGPHAYLCEDHVRARRAAGADPARNGHAGPPATSAGPVAACLAALRAELQQADARRAKLAAAITALEALDP